MSVAGACARVVGCSERRARCAARRCGGDVTDLILLSLWHDPTWTWVMAWREKNCWGMAIAHRGHEPPEHTGGGPTRAARRGAACALVLRCAVRVCAPAWGHAATPCGHALWPRPVATPCYCISCWLAREAKVDVAHLPFRTLSVWRSVVVICCTAQSLLQSARALSSSRMRSRSAIISRFCAACRALGPFLGGSVRA